MEHPPIQPELTRVATLQPRRRGSIEDVSRRRRERAFGPTFETVPGDPIRESRVAQIHPIVQPRFRGEMARRLDPQRVDPDDSTPPRSLLSYLFNTVPHIGVQLLGYLKPIDVLSLMGADPDSRSSIISLMHFEFQDQADIGTYDFSMASEPNPVSGLCNVVEWPNYPPPPILVPNGQFGTRWRTEKNDFTNPLWANITPRINRPWVHRALNFGGNPPPVDSMTNFQLSPHYIADDWRWCRRRNHPPEDGPFDTTCLDLGYGRAAYQVEAHWKPVCNTCDKYFKWVFKSREWVPDGYNSCTCVEKMIDMTCMPCSGRCFDAWRRRMDDKYAAWERDNVEMGQGVESYRILICPCGENMDPSILPYQYPVSDPWDRLDEERMSYTNERTKYCLECDGIIHSPAARLSERTPRAVGFRSRATFSQFRRMKLEARQRGEYRGR
ncbi:hypothetical protein DL95DRAFT_408977 [Leptodontidium sp. 2 PMI_412]|nr:hypothetical protein DL95DRAFT_408977 [Leptodontidium sp. 2 PMI_412]